MSQMLGRCFLAAIHTLEQVPSATLVHGLLTNPSGRKVCHAWLEFTENYIEYVSDPSVEKIFLKSVFYDGYKPEKIHKYTSVHAFNIVNETECLGPWAPDLMAHQFANGAQVTSSTKKSRKFIKEQYEKWKKENAAKS